ncbi:tetratricopeptide repeat protein [Lusitaniella coriacea LEGE 07157]|uniref:Tetratricopeptide repeat protein n=1 Tax=Lusitaniella coriacea LEGE 07157 TaxID=945747 RepID=A0A8J7ISA3_9CYAN|nr:tetratricopeptide repeat protein [Lusitaniella coriacea]MBE9116027.1 tetratricopeptide repeat protein [Lusitaniella coriacea LEGE 07157]
MDVNNCEFLHQQGEQLARSGDYEAALKHYNQSLEIDPSDYLAWIRRGCILTHLDRYQEALESFETALSICPQDRTAWVFRGVTLHHLGDYDRAYSSYARSEGKERSAIASKLTQVVHRFLDAAMSEY